MRIRDYPQCGDAGRCILAVDHGRRHQDAWGALWDRTDPELCEATCPDVVTYGAPDWECVLNKGHQGHHSTLRGSDWHGSRGSRYA